MENKEELKLENRYTKKEYEIKKGDNKIRIEINNDEIIIILIIGLSYYKYIKKYKYEEIVKELELYEYNNIKEIYNYLIKSEYKIINKEKIKKIIINDKEMNLNKKILTNEELLKILINEINNQNEKITYMMKFN